MCAIKKTIMLIIHHSITTTASAAAIWRLYEDTTTWPTWDHGLEKVHLDGPFETGTRGTLRPKGGPNVPFVITALEKERSFSDISSLPFTRLIFTHSLEKEGNKLRVTHHAEMKGLLAPFFAIIIGIKIKAELPTAMKQLVAMAEQTAI